ncbi:MAG: hypothetical protein KGI97_05700 [Alphaproteobacteria bacterium]|nr:hypothetical protein [Alphaproteobacteria bacterium]
MSSLVKASINAAFLLSTARTAAGLSPNHRMSKAKPSRPTRMRTPLACSHLPSLAATT